METAVILAKTDLPAERAKYLLSEFGDMVTLAESWETTAKNLVIVDENDTDSMEVAKKGAKEMKKKRLSLAEIHKTLKANALAEGQFLDLVKRTLLSHIEVAEEEYDKKARFKELAEKVRKQETWSKRCVALSEFGVVGQTVDPASLLDMTEDVWQMVYSGLKVKYEKFIMEEADRREQEEREFLAQEEEKKKLKEENDRLAKEAKKKDAEIEKERKENEEKLLVEREERERVERELKAKQKKEEDDKKAEASRKRKERTAPDREKLLGFAEMIIALRPHSLKTDEAKLIEANAFVLLQKTHDYIVKNVKGLEE